MSLLAPNTMTREVMQNTVKAINQAVRQERNKRFKDLPGPVFNFVAPNAYPMDISVPGKRLEVSIGLLYSEHEIANALFNAEMVYVKDQLSSRITSDTRVYVDGWAWDPGSDTMVASVHACAVSDNRVYIQTNTCIRPNQTPVPALMKFDPLTGESPPYPSEARQYLTAYPESVWIYDPYTGEAIPAEPMEQLNPTVNVGEIGGPVGSVTLADE